MDFEKEKQRLEKIVKDCKNQELYHKDIISNFRKRIEKARKEIDDMEKSNEDKNKEDEGKKAQYLFLFDKLKRKGVKIDGKFTMESKLEDMKKEYDRIHSELERDNMVKKMKEVMLCGVNFIEYGSKKYMNMNLNGLTDSMFKEIDNYDDVFNELYDKYKDKMDVPMNPEMKLLMMIGGQFFMQKLTNDMFNKESDEVVLKRKMEKIKERNDFENAINHLRMFGLGAKKEDNIYWKYLHYKLVSSRMESEEEDFEYWKKAKAFDKKREEEEKKKKEKEEESKREEVKVTKNVNKTFNKLYFSKLYKDENDFIKFMKSVGDKYGDVDITKEDNVKFWEYIEGLKKNGLNDENSNIYSEFLYHKYVIIECKEFCSNDYHNWKRAIDSDKVLEDKKAMLKNIEDMKKGVIPKKENKEESDEEFVKRIVGDSGNNEHLKKASEGLKKLLGDKEEDIKKEDKENEKYRRYLAVFEEQLKKHPDSRILKKNVEGLKKHLDKEEDIKKDFKIDEEMMKKMVSGEEVVVAKMHKEVMTDDCAQEGAFKSTIDYEDLKKKAINSTIVSDDEDAEEKDNNEELKETEGNESEEYEQVDLPQVGGKKEG